VSKVLNGQMQVAPKTERRIWRIARELDYRPNVSARNLRTQGSNLIGCAWVPTYQGTWRPILNSFLHTVIAAAEQHGYLTTFFTGPENRGDMRIYADLFLQRQTAGFVLAETTPDDSRVAFLLERHIPFVTFGQANPDWDFCWVDVDGQDGIRQVMNHLIELGHQRISLISWELPSQTGVHREQAYADALVNAGLKLDSAWIYRGADSADAGWLGFTHMMSLSPERRPTAIVCVSDHIAVGVVNAALAEGLRIGHDIAITGYDDVHMARYLHPPLTSVRQPIDEVGQRVVELLVNQLDGVEPASRSVLLKPELIVRDSSQPATRAVI
jgi:DNA-binding LacI/PurR family transcriptional regulator